MASASIEKNEEKPKFFDTLTHFPDVNNKRINIEQFLAASSDLVTIVERLGKLFAPVKYDIQGNIDKIKREFIYNKDSCLLKLMKDETENGRITANEGVLWLNRALWLFELVFQEIILCLQANEYNVGMKKIFTVAYEGSIKKYHNWMAQQIFALICKMSPSLPDVLKAMAIGEDVKHFENGLIKYNQHLNSVRCTIDDYFVQNNMFIDSR